MKRIEDYFKPKTSIKKKKMDPEQNVELTADIDVAGSSGVQEAVEKSSVDLASKEETLSCKLSEFKEKFRFDIGLYQRSLSDSEKHQFLKNCWVPDRQYQFPPSDRNLRFQKKWLDEFPWLAYSHEKCGAFCKFCVIFAANFEAGKGSHVTLRNLVKTPLTKWKKAKENFHDHECRQYHVRACEAAQNFMSTFEKRQDDIVMQIAAGRKVQVEENRKKLTPIIKTVLFCGMEGLPLRGHNESGPILENREGSDGKFRALIKFRVDAGDEILKHHLESAQSNATYLSPQIQNEIIETCGNMIVDRIVERVNKSGIFTVLADETADISGIEQFSLCVRYVDQIDEKYTVCEDFLKFVPITDLRGASLATVLLQSLNDVGLDLKKMRGLGFDGAANMSGAFNGCAAKINEQYTNALYVHCANHSLNLALSHSCSVPDIKNCIGTLKSVITFFRISPKREAVLKKHIKNIDNEERRKRLLKFCETRWTEHLDAVSRFASCYSAIITSLGEIQDFPDSEASSKAFTLSSALQHPSFIISMCVVNHIFALSYGVANALQAKHIDLKNCVTMSENLIKELTIMRENFKPIYEEAGKLAAEIGATLSIPRRTGRQTSRANFDTEDCCEYYKLSVFLPFLDYFTSQLHERFMKHKGILQNIEVFLPFQVVKASDSEIARAIKEVMKQWPDDVISTEVRFLNEVKMWRRKFLEDRASKKPEDFITSLDVCDQSFFPTLHNILKLCATLPVTTASAERSFSTLRILKNYLRNTISDVRLNGLTQMYIHKNLTSSINVEEILDKLSKKPRRMLLV